MVAAARRGMSLRATARKYGAALSTVQFWVQRASGHRLGRVDWQDRPPIARRTRRTRTDLEDRILALRLELRDQSDLGEFGARAIHERLRADGVTAPPSIRTIGRVLERRGALDGRHRVRRQPPPRGWYLPDLAACRAELDSFDYVEGLVIEGGIPVEVLTGTSLHGGLVGAWPLSSVSARQVADQLVGHWREFGLPRYAQFDNGTCFQGAHHIPDVLGRVTRVCLSLNVVPVFVPPRETGFQAAIENLNGRWQAKVWARFHHDSLADLIEHSRRYVAASRHRAGPRIDVAPPRRRFPKNWVMDLYAPAHGSLVYLRRTNEEGVVSLMGHSYPLPSPWTHRLVRCEVDLDFERIRFFALRRRSPADQPLIGEHKYVFPRRRLRFLE
jgi:hypothetical protein